MIHGCGAQDVFCPDTIRGINSVRVRHGGAGEPRWRLRRRQNFGCRR